MISISNQSIHYGARFAAKESFLKALGIGLGMGVKLSEIEVVHDKNGKPDPCASWWSQSSN